jgi:hypothetical protein
MADGILKSIPRREMQPTLRRNPTLWQQETPNQDERQAHTQERPIIAARTDAADKTDNHGA